MVLNSTCLNIYTVYKFVCAFRKNEDKCGDPTVPYRIPQNCGNSKFTIENSPHTEGEYREVRFLANLMHCIFVTVFLCTPKLLQFIYRQILCNRTTELLITRWTDELENFLGYRLSDKGSSTIDYRIKDQVYFNCRALNQCCCL